MQIIRDYLGWDYSTALAIALVIVWFSILLRWAEWKKDKERERRHEEYQRTGKEAENEPKRNIWKRILHSFIILLLLGHIALTAWGTAYFGLGTPTDFTAMHVTDDKIVLFDVGNSFFDAKYGNKDESAQLRISVVDRKSHEKMYEDMIGTDFGTFVDSNGVFVMGYERNTDNSAVGKELYTVFEYDLDKQEKIRLFQEQGTTTANDKEVQVYSIEIWDDILMTTDQGDEYEFDTYSRSFIPIQEKDDYANSNRKHFSTAQCEDAPKKEHLIIDGKRTDPHYFDAEIVETHYNEQGEYVMLHTHPSLSNNHCDYNLLNGEGEWLWKTCGHDLAEFHGDSEHESIQQFEFYEDVLYITANEYLFELDIESGKINWSLKL